MSGVTEVEHSDPPDESIVPRLAEGVSLCGEYEGGGYETPRYLVARSDGQMVLVSEMLYTVAEGIDGNRDLREVAEYVGGRLGKELTAHSVQYLIDEKLFELGVATTTEPVDKPAQAKPLLSLMLRGVLLPAGVVRPIAAVLAPMFYPIVIALVASGLIAVDIALVVGGYLDAAFVSAAGNPIQVLTVLGLLVSSTLFHELGHAAGCRYGGGKPGAVGVGILLVFPAFFTNVTDAYRLGRRGRLRTDLGGIYFNAVYILGVAALFAWTQFPPLLVFIALSQIQMLQQMLPLLRLDGYYILGDLVGVPNLFGQIRPFLQRLAGKHELAGRSSAGLRPRVQIIVTVWVAIVVPVLLFALLSLLFRVPRYLSTALARGQDFWFLAVDGFGNGNTGTAILAVFSILIVLLPWVGGTTLVVRTLKKIVAPRLRRRRANATNGRHRQAVGRWTPSRSRV